MNRTQLITIGSIVAVILLAVGVYFLFFAPRSGTVSVNPGNTFGEGDNRDAVDSSQQTLGDGVNERKNAGTDVAPRFVKISSGPVSYGVSSHYLPEKKGVMATGTDGIATKIDTPADVEIRYIERLSGNIYSYMVHGRTLTRISNQTIPGVVEASWLSDGSRAYARFENAEGAEETYATPQGESEGFFLESGLAGVTTNGTNELFTLLANSNGSVGTVSRVDGTSAKTLFTSTLSSLSLAYAGKNLIATTKPSAQIDGYSFLVSHDSGSFTRLLGPLRGLATLPSPTGAMVVYSNIQNGTPTLTLRNVKTKEDVALPLLTLADKCAWTADELTLYCAASRAVPQGLPDSWYQGASSFTDRIWKIDIQNRVAIMVFDPQQVADLAIDAVSLTLDGASDTLTFTNRKDGALYVFDL